MITDKEPKRIHASLASSNNHVNAGQPMMFTPYSFGFDEQNLSRQETADISGNVKGRYAYTNRDGNKIEVKYSAGAEKGFVIENEAALAESVSKATKDTSSPIGSSSSTLDVRQTYNAPSVGIQTNNVDR